MTVTFNGNGPGNWDSSGNLGVGTATPAYRLDVRTSDTTNPAGYFYNTSAASNSPALIARGGANNADAARIISAQDYSGNEEFGISGTGEFRINAGFGSAGLAYGCRAWVNFDGTGTPAIRASGNVTSITDNGTGDYTLNFTTAMPDANFSMVGTTNADSRTVSISSLSTASARVRTSNTAAALVDLSVNCVAVFR